MPLKDLTPWRWGGLRHWRAEDKPMEGFRREITTLQQDIDRLFEDFWHNAVRWPESREMWGASGFDLRVDETEDDGAYHVTMELPGMDEKDVEVTVADGRLTIRGKKKARKDEEGKDFLRRERTFGSFRRTLTLPGAVDEAKIEASFRKGVLTIDLPKTEESKKKVKHISIKAA